MPLFVFIGHGPALGGELRADVRPAHPAAARQVATRDPYVTRGVFARYEVYETRVVFSRDSTTPSPS
jgi:uncharacterized protein YciI